MKKLHINYFILVVMIAGLFSCGDNEDFSNLHELTDSEIEEIARQDSIEEAEKNRINANLILEYSTDIIVSETSYDGSSVSIDLDKIAELFEISKEDLLAGIAGESGAPEIKGFAIDSTTHRDYGSASTAGSAWGHWWGANGDVTEYSSVSNLAACFAEFDTETGEFYVGQYPDRLSAGQIIPIIEALQYNQQRVAVVITINAIEPG